MNTLPQAQNASEHFADLDVQLISSQAILNEALLAQYEALDDDITDDPLLPKLFSIFQKSLPEHMKHLALALQRQDESDVNYLIHKMLGMAHNVGALRLADILMVLEQADSATRMRLDAGQLAILHAEYKTAEAALIQQVNGRAH